MTLAIEPIIAMGNPAMETLSDGWSTRTLDRSLVGHFEHTVVVTMLGFEIITK
jgi:methionyl aminopeptidase